MGGGIGHLIGLMEWMWFILLLCGWDGRQGRDWVVSLLKAVVWGWRDSTGDKALALHANNSG